MRMKRFLLVIPVWVCLIVSAQSYAQTITFERHMPHTSDSLLAYKLPYIAVTDSGRNCIWDFSHLPMDSAEIIEINHYAPSADTMIVGLHRERANYYYHCVHDTLWMTGFENAHTHVRYSDPFPLLKYPFVYGDSLGGTYSGKGQYCHILPVRAEGTCSVHADAMGKLILPDMEIDSVLRVHTKQKYVTIENDTTTAILETYCWYVQDIRYPLFEISKVNVYGKEDSAGIANAYYIAQEQPNINFLKKKKDVTEDVTDSLGIIISCMPNPVQSNLYITYQLTNDADVYISIHSNCGIPLFSSAQKRQEKGEHLMIVNVTSYPIGSYVIYLHVDDTTYARTIIKI